MWQIPRASKLDTLILFVTSRCNSKCRTCVYWEELNQDGDLSFEEIDRLSSTMPRFNEVWFSGGEPRLREELPEITHAFHERNGVRSINLPANGLLVDKLVTAVESILDTCRGLRINLNIALDGLEKTHDQIRGVLGNFNRALETLEALRTLCRHAPDLRGHINSVLCKENIEEMLPLGRFVRDRCDLDGHYFQVIREEPMDSALLGVHKESISALYEELQPLPALRRKNQETEERPRRFADRLVLFGNVESLSPNTSRQPGGTPSMADGLHGGTEYRGCRRQRRHTGGRASESARQHPRFRLRLGTLLEVASKSPGGRRHRPRRLSVYPRLFHPRKRQSESQGHADGCTTRLLESGV